MTQRDTAPDVLRGFALLGILVVNIQFMGLNSDQGARGEWVQGFANGSATFIISAIFAGKFYLLFSFLFGYSSNYIIRGEAANGARWIKRCIALILLGILHFTFLWHGDIIFMYGLFGLLLTAFFFRTDRTLKIWSRSFFGVSAFLFLLFGALVFIVERVLNEDLQVTTESNLDVILRDGTFVESIPARLELWSYSILSGVFLQGGLAFAAFLLGLRMARSQFLSSPIDSTKNSQLIKYGLIFGVPIQVIVGLVMVQNEQMSKPSEALYLMALAVSFLTAPLLSMLYVGAIRKLVEEKPHLVTWMRPAGAMSLTVYISQSVIASMIFSPWGLGLFQELQTWHLVLLAFGIWLGLVYFSTIWLRKFNQGPLERLLSTLTRNRKVD